jgi:hypothetical protein
LDSYLYFIFTMAVPFIILSIDNGQSPEDVDPNATPGENAQVSQQTGVLLALFAAGILSKCFVPFRLARCQQVGPCPKWDQLY